LLLLLLLLLLLFVIVDLLRLRCCYCCYGYTFGVVHVVVVVTFVVVTFCWLRCCCFDCCCFTLTLFVTLLLTVVTLRCVNVVLLLLRTFTFGCPFTLRCCVTVCSVVVTVVVVVGLRLHVTARYAGCRLRLRLHTLYTHRYAHTRFVALRCLVTLRLVVDGLYTRLRYVWFTLRLYTVTVVAFTFAFTLLLFYTFCCGYAVPILLFYVYVDLRCDLLRLIYVVAFVVLRIVVTLRCALGWVVVCLLLPVTGCYVVTLLTLLRCCCYVALFVTLPVYVVTRVCGLPHLYVVHGYGTFTVTYTPGLYVYVAVTHVYVVRALLRYVTLLRWTLLGCYVGLGWVTTRILVVHVTYTFTLFTRLVTHHTFPRCIVTHGLVYTRYVTRSRGYLHALVTLRTVTRWLRGC